MTQQAIVTEAAAATIEEKAPHRPEQRLSKNRRSFRMFLCIVPFLVLVFLFSYFPLYGWIYSLYDYRPALGLAGSDFVGLQWFQLLVGSPTQVAQVGQVVINTLAISFLGIATSILPLAFAIFLNEIKAPWFRNSVQTLTTLPNFISWVLVYMIAFSLFSSSGLVNGILSDAGLITTPVKFLDTDQNVWITMTLWSIWKGLGWGAIIYLAAIAGIDQSLYESAEIDGAGRFQKMWYITVPQLMPTYLVLLLLSIANLLNNGMEQYFVFQNAFNKDYIQVLDLYVYNIGMTGNNLSMATAIGMLKSLISVILLFTVNGIAKRVRGESIV
ncbi:ABC transporter permease subunit [Microbacterium sp. KSW4-11]|uniref:ABC transporter permease subunit n=1 Tax=Microbacterium gawkjiense TaxID=3067309 RepID=A0ABU3G7K5_9MICO|nr:ABC transporter permease subunit [Microbacterium sp. KSW4-11]MDT3315807.1 ABC transporter permease subunit [Microbacterium sp. KSW4-11]